MFTSPKHINQQTCQRTISSNLKAVKAMQRSELGRGSEACPRECRSNYTLQIVGEGLSKESDYSLKRMKNEMHGYEGQVTLKRLLV